MPPHLQLVRHDRVPVHRHPGAELKLYSGQSGDVVSPTRNVAPVTVADIRLELGVSFEQELPLTYNGFLLVLEGEVIAGESFARVSVGQAG